CRTTLSGRSTEHSTSEHTTASNGSLGSSDSIVPAVTVTGTAADSAAFWATAVNRRSGSTATTSVTVSGYSGKFVPVPAPTSKTRPASPARFSRRHFATDSGSWVEMNIHTRATNGLSTVLLIEHFLQHENGLVRRGLWVNGPGHHLPYDGGPQHTVGELLDIPPWQVRPGNQHRGHAMPNRPQLQCNDGRIALR